MNKQLKKRYIILGLLLFIGLGFLMKAFFDNVLPPQEEVQTWMADRGFLGWLAYFLFGTTAVFFVPLNFSLTGIAGGFVYGLWPAFFTNWACKIIGTFIAFLLGKHFGHKILPLFSEATQKKYYKLATSEQATLTYIILSSIPFTPSDALAYFLGTSKMKKRNFLGISILGSTGTSFSLAYVGSGAAFNSPILLAVLACGLVGTLSWIHFNKDKLGLS